MEDGVKKYAQTWFRLDQRYRKFIHHARESGQASLLQDLNHLIENLYTNNFLVRLNDRWQIFVDASTRWEAASVISQSQFFSRFVRPYLDRKTKVCVLISDAFRYEIGEELQSLIRREDRFDAELVPVLSCLPSYTQLGKRRAHARFTTDLISRVSRCAGVSDLRSGIISANSLNVALINQTSSPCEASL